VYTARFPAWLGEALERRGAERRTLVLVNFNPALVRGSHYSGVNFSAWVVISEDALKCVRDSGVQSS